MRPLFVALLFLVATAASASVPAKLKSPTAKDSQLALRCANAAIITIGAAEAHPSSKGDRTDLWSGMAKDKREQEVPYAPRELEMFSASYDVEVMLESGLTRDRMIGHASAVCALAVRLNEA